MKCDMCDNEATVFLTQIVEGKMTKANLCEKCSKEKGVTDPAGFQLADFLLGSGTPKKSRASGTEDDSLACPSCGFTRAHLKKIGRMGCPECYQTFAEDLENMLRAMHKGTRHVGKSPARSASSPQPLPPSHESAEKHPPKTSGSPPPVDGDLGEAKSEVTVKSPPAPPPPAKPVSPKKRIADLKAQIDLAVSEERYEDAARLRDEVRALESETSA